MFLQVLKWLIKQLVSQPGRRYLQKSVKRGQRGEEKRGDEGYKSLQLNILSDGLVDG